MIQLFVVLINHLMLLINNEMPGHILSWTKVQQQTCFRMHLCFNQHNRECPLSYKCPQSSSVLFASTPVDPSAKDTEVTGATLREPIRVRYQPACGTITTTTTCGGWWTHAANPRRYVGQTVECRVRTTQVLIGALLYIWLWWIFVYLDAVCEE